MYRYYIPDKFSYSKQMATSLTNQSEINRIYGAGMKSFGGISYRILASPGNNNIPIYECMNPNFISLDKNCGGRTFIRLSGYLYKTAVANSVAIYAKKSSLPTATFFSIDYYWITQDPNEGGGIIERILGYGLLQTTYTNA
jgi:hypothetical protein